MNKSLVLLTGASGGLAEKMIPLFVENGYKLALQAGKRAAELQKKVQQYGDSCRVYACDISRSSEREKLVQSVREQQGDPAILINNAGMSSAGISWKIPADEWHRVHEINLHAPFHFSQLCIPAMKKNGFGRIVYMSSVVGQMGIMGTAAYSSSKSALLGLTRTQSVELIKSGVTVNAVAPGYMDAGMIEVVPPDMQIALKERIPAGYFGRAEEIAHTVEWLISEKASYVSGQVINVNGGLYS